MLVFDLNTGGFRHTSAKRQHRKNRIWYYQFPGDSVRKLYKNGKWWTYSTKGDMSQVSADSLAGAKGDIVYGGGKVWSQLED